MIDSITNVPEEGEVCAAKGCNILIDPEAVAQKGSQRLGVILKKRCIKMQFALWRYDREVTSS